MNVIIRDPNRGYVDTMLWVPKTFINVDGTKRALTQVFVDRYTGNTKVLTMYQEAPHHLLVPRAFWDVGALPFDVIDCRPLSYAHISFVSKVKLDHRIQEHNGVRGLFPTGDDVQQKSINALQAAMGGILQLACGKGKTCIALHHLATEQVPALVLVDNTQLMEQWKQEMEALIEVPGGVGYLVAGQRDWQKGLVLATYQTIASWADDMPEEVRRWFGNIYWDEGHHVSAPVFARTAALFYGNRYSLTATPKREDGLDIIADLHIGKVLHKDLSQPLKARFIFFWTGLELDLTDPNCAVLDKNGEVHTSKVFQYYGRWRQRLWMILQHSVEAVSTGRRVLLVGASVDEVVNLMALWTRGPHAPLINDLPYPQPADVGGNAFMQPLVLNDIEGKKLDKNLARARERCAKIKKGGGNPRAVEDQIQQIELEIERYQLHRKLENEYDKRRTKFIRELMEEQSTAGFLTYEVPAKKRQEFLATRQVIFAIMKYGKEGLNAPDLDTILVSTPFSQKGGLQQLMGRITGRPMPGKKKCVVVFYRDNIGVMHGMCRKLESHLREWPVDEGGPFDYEELNNPERVRWQKVANLKTAFGQ